MLGYQVGAERMHERKGLQITVDLRGRHAGGNPEFIPDYWSKQVFLLWDHWVIEHDDESKNDLLTLGCNDSRGHQEDNALR